MSYAQTAESIYDLVYTSFKDYGSEAARVDRFIEDNCCMSSIGQWQVLDVACGTALHAGHLAKKYKVVGVDLSPDMLATARRRLPDVEFVEGDMRNFDLGRLFAAVMCLFSAIGHLKNIEELIATIANFARHTQPGGVVIVEPWLLPHMYNPGLMHGVHVDRRPEFMLARYSHITREGNMTHLDMHHLVNRPDGVEYFVEHHDLMMFTEEEYLKAFAAAGLVARYESAGLSNNGRGVFIATKPL